MNILLIEDDALLADQISMLLRKERYTCDVCSTLREAKAVLERNSYQLMILDWTLPDGSGIDLLRTLRKEAERTPVIVISGRERVSERVEALDAGADDYLCKPYSNMELLARIRALLRRESTQKSSQLVHDDLLLDLTARSVTVKNNAVHLTGAEFELLEVLMLNKNRIISRYEITELLCKDFDAIKSSNFVDVHIKNLRKKLDRPDMITTVRGIGYTIKT